MNAKKLTAILMCMLMIGLIPVAAGATTHQPEPAIIQGTTLIGIVTAVKRVNGGHDISLRCVWVHYITHNSLQRRMGVFHALQRIEVNDLHMHGWIWARPLTLGTGFIFAHFNDYVVHW